MERLTYRLEDQHGNPTDTVILAPYKTYHDAQVRKDILNRLASYEDTGLTPQEIEQTKAQKQRLTWLERLELIKAMMGRDVDYKTAEQILVDFQKRMDRFEEANV